MTDKPGPSTTSSVCRTCADLLCTILTVFSQFARGCYHSLVATQHLYTIVSNQIYFHKLCSVWCKNALLILLARAGFFYSVHQYVEVHNWFAYGVLLGIFYFFYFPCFLYCYIITLDTINYIHNQELARRSTRTTQQSMNVDTSLYMVVMSFVVYSFPLLFSSAPSCLAWILVPLVTATINSFYYYYTSQLSLSHDSTSFLVEFDNNIAFFVGYGVLECLVYTYTSWEWYYMLNILILPMNILQLARSPWKQPNTTASTSTGYTWFALPLILTNMLLDVLLYATSIIYKDTSMIGGTPEPPSDESTESASSSPSIR